MCMPAHLEQKYGIYYWNLLWHKKWHKMGNKNVYNILCSNLKKVVIGKLLQKNGNEIRKTLYVFCIWSYKKDLGKLWKSHE